MKRTLAILLTLIIMVSICACMNGGNASAVTTADKEYANQDEFLKDMAKGISNRLAAVADDKERTDEEKSEYYQMLVNYELDKIEKYADETFSDASFDEMAHYYIEACQMQLYAAKNYRNDNLYAMWSPASQIRTDIILEMYSHYNLPITSEEAENYSSGNTVTYTITGISDAVAASESAGAATASQSSAAEAIEILSFEAKPSSGGYTYACFTVKNATDSPIKMVSLSIVYLDKDGNIVNSNSPLETARLLSGQTEVIQDVSKTDLNITSAYVDRVIYEDAEGVSHEYYTSDPVIYTMR